MLSEVKKIYVTANNMIVGEFESESRPGVTHIAYIIPGTHKRYCSCEYFLYSNLYGGREKNCKHIEFLYRLLKDKNLLKRLYELGKISKEDYHTILSLTTD